MKKLLTMLEDIWVAVAFAEAGEYEFLLTDKVQPQYRTTARMRAL
jgi:hypothetical protein